MKLIIVLSAVAWCSAAQLERAYLPPRGQSSPSARQPHSPSPLPHHGDDVDNAHYAQFTGDFQSRPERTQAAFERNAAIIRQENQNDGGRYSYAYETENGISAEEQGVASDGVEAQGGYSYTGDDGQLYTVRYTAGVNGFVAEGAHLPTPPPVPAEILRALEQNARDEAAGIYDDGSYNAAKYSGAQQNGLNTEQDDDSVTIHSAAGSPPAPAYLPPFARSSPAPARRTSFNERSGYTY